MARRSPLARAAAAATPPPPPPLRALLLLLLLLPLLSAAQLEPAGQPDAAAAAAAAAVPAPHRPVRYWMYEPRLFLANRGMPGDLAFVPKHSVDSLFLRDLFLHEAAGPPIGLFPRAEEAAFANGTRGRVPPGERVDDPGAAQIFVIPVPCSKVFGSGGNDEPARARRARHMADLVRQLTHLKPGVHDHLLVCDYYGTLDLTDRLPEEIIVGAMERASGRYLPVGYSTFDAVRALARDPQQERPAAPGPMAPAGARKYRLSFLGGFGKGFYGHIRELLNTQLHKPGTVVPPDFYFHGSQGEVGRLGWEDASAVMRDSLVCLHLGGDTITSDRLYNAFDTRCIPASLDVDREVPRKPTDSLLSQLSSPSAVPWERLILWVNTTHWREDPIASLRAAVDSLSEAEAEERLRLVEQYRPDVSWTWTDSRASFNLLRSALEKKEAMQAAADAERRALDDAAPAPRRAARSAAR